MPPHVPSFHCRPSSLSPTQLSPTGTSTPTQGPYSPSTSPIYRAKARNRFRFEDIMQGMPISNVAPRGDISCNPSTKTGGACCCWGAGSGLSTAILIVSEDPFLLMTVRTVELLSDETLPSGISSSMMAAALLLPLIVLADEGCPLLFVEDNDVFFSTTFRTTSGFFGEE